MGSRIDILAIGDAIVDVIAPGGEGVLAGHGLRKGTMRPLDQAGADALQAAMGPATMAPGGSAANTVAVAAALGLRGGFVGKVRDDEAGRMFARDMAASGIRFPLAPAPSGPATSRCLVVVTPDGERTMGTHLGACQTLGPEEVDMALVAEARNLYLEGYAWGAPRLARACEEAIGASLSAGGSVSLTLSDPTCAEAHRELFLDLAGSGRISVLFANAREACALFSTADEEAAIGAMRRLPLTAVVTRGAAGCVVCHGSDAEPVPASPVRRLVDTTGAGDAFAGGFMAGHARGFSPRDSARLGALVAAEVVQQLGARPRTDVLAIARAGGYRL